MISRTTAEQALRAAVRTGGDFAEIFLEDTKSSVLSLSQRKIEDAVIRRIHGAGIRVYRGLTSVYVHTNDTSPSGLTAAAEKAGAALEGANPDGTPADIHLVGSLQTNLHPIREMPMDVSGARRAGILKTADAAARDVAQEVSQVEARLLCREQDVLVANTGGLFIPDRRVYTRLAVSVTASGNGENQVGFEGPGALMGFELFQERVDPGESARAAALRAVTMLRADACPAGVMPVVIDSGFGGVLFHEACGHSLEAASVAFGNSEFTGKLGQKIAADCVTAIDDGTIPNAWGSTNIDDEGNPATRLVLIENGILKNYMVDRLNGRRMHMPSTGSGRRQDYTFAPTSRMRNTFIAAGNDSEEEMLSTMGDGLYAKSMGGGSVNPITGSFNFAVAEGYLVRGGRIDRPVRGATLVGRGKDVLLRIDRVGRTVRSGQGMCGASSGSVPTNVGQPMIRVSEMTVGGR